MEYLYLAVNSDGTEIASNFHLFRAWDKMTEWSTPTYRKEHPLENYCENQWMNCIEETDYGYYGEDYSFDGITLPPGTIEKLTGHKLTWEDEPIEIKWIEQYEKIICN